MRPYLNGTHRNTSETSYPSGQELVLSPLNHSRYLAGKATDLSQVRPLSFSLCYLFSANHMKQGLTVMEMISTKGSVDVASAV
jgi:hypothetical protein